MRRRLATAPLLAALALMWGATGALAQEATDPPAETIEAGPDEPTESTEGEVMETSGIVEAITDPDGRDRYYLRLEDDTLVELRFGPPWFRGPRSPLDDLVGQTVTIGGDIQDPEPDEQASETAIEEAVTEPVLNVKTVDGERLKGRGRPPWAGGPKVVGEVHPGYEDWSRGHAAKAEAKATKAEVKATKAEAKAMKAEERASPS